jgi:hypothetical protein
MIYWKQIYIDEVTVKRGGAEPAQSANQTTRKSQCRLSLIPTPKKVKRSVQVRPDGPLYYIAIFVTVSHPTGHRSGEKEADCQDRGIPASLRAAYTP